MMFYLDMESSANNMKNLSHVQKALQGVVKDLQQKIDRGQGEVKCNGEIKDGNGNVIGEWDYRPEESEELPFNDASYPFVDEY